MRRSNWLIGVAFVTLGALVASAAWAELPPKREFLPVSNGNPVTNPSLPMITVTTTGTVYSCASTGPAAGVVSMRCPFCALLRRAASMSRLPNE